MKMLVKTCLLKQKQIQSLPCTRAFLTPALQAASRAVGSVETSSVQAPSCRSTSTATTPPKFPTKRLLDLFLMSEAGSAVKQALKSLGGAVHSAVQCQCSALHSGVQGGGVQCRAVRSEGGWRCGAVCRCSTAPQCSSPLVTGARVDPALVLLQILG